MAATVRVVNRSKVGWVKSGAKAASNGEASGGRITAAVLGRRSWSFSNPMLAPRRPLKKLHQSSLGTSVISYNLSRRGNSMLSMGLLVPPVDPLEDRRGQ